MKLARMLSCRGLIEMSDNERGSAVSDDANEEDCEDGGDVAGMKRDYGV